MSKLTATTLLLALSFLSTSAWAELRAVSVNTANFRDGPSTKDEIVYSADKFYAVEILKVKDGWAQTRDFEGEVAWVAERLLTKQRAVVVKVACAIIRAEPDMKSDKAFKLDRGEGMRVLGRKGVWLHVKDDQGREGWVHRDVVWRTNK